ncbi:MAG TPA: T9SS type A sorting domain-containing protein [Moheibacter sp.]|nr:T9SS type A sorting domain-containing protein [Moheibacter sp.]
MLVLVLALIPMKGNAQYEQIQKVVGDREERAEFGTSVALNDHFAVVGASRENIAAGAAYVFRKTEENNWDFSQKIVADDAFSMAEFGGGMKFGDGFLAIASGRADIQGTERAGAVYVYKQVENNWISTIKLTASDYSPNALLAVNPTSIDTYEKTIVAGAPGTNNWTGAVYVFENQDGNWTETQKITAPEEFEFINFGIGVSVSENFLIAGASGENNGAGSAYIYEKNDTGNWEFVQKITASDAQSNMYFGNSISISGNQIVVGAYAEGSVGGNIAAAYIFEQNEAGEWLEIQKIPSPISAENTYFAWMVEMNESRIAISCPHVWGAEPGKVYIYQKINDGTWEETQILAPNEDMTEDSFGWSIAMNGGDLIVGVPRDEFDENGENGMMDPGSAFIFTNGDLGVLEEITTTFVSVYPNPSKDFIWINSSKPVQSVEVYSVTGKKVIDSKELSLDISTLPKANYFIKINLNSGETIHRKFIKN